MKTKSIRLLTLLLSLLALACFATACTNGHTHEYSTEYFNDDSYHWFECECGEDKGKTAHKFTDGKCECGFEEKNESGDGTSHTHEYGINNFDTVKHWKECACGDKKEITQHSFTGGVCSCGYKEKAEGGGQTPSTPSNPDTPSTPEHTHKFDRMTIHDDYLKSKATCENKAVYYYACKCGEKGSETYEYGDPLFHNYGEFVSNGDGTKTAKCANGCGIDKTVDEEHYCDYKKGQTVAPTCETSGYTIYECECGSSYESDWQYPLGHSYGNWVSNGDDTHTKTCANDNSHKITDDCYAGWDEVIHEYMGTYATCTKKAVCGYCNAEFGELKPHTYAEEYNYSTGKYEPIYSHDGNRHWQEVTCGCDIEPNYEDHGTDGNNCMACEYPLKPTEGIIYDKSADGTCAEVIGYEGSAKKIKIADTYEGLPVKNIYNRAFENADITFVIIPDSVTSIGNYAFYYCDWLTSVVIGDSVETIGSSAFYDCDSLTSVVIGDSVTSIGAWAFYSCDSLTSVVIGDSVETIGSSAFEDCYSLTSVVIGDGVESIGSSAFEDCNNLQFNEYENCKYLGSSDNEYFALIEVVNKNLTSYTIHEDTKIIAESAFSGCGRLASIVIPDSVISIGEWAFTWCDSLTSVVIGDSVTSIGLGAFDACDSLKVENITVKDPNGWQYFDGKNWNNVASNNVAQSVRNVEALRKVK